MLTPSFYTLKIPSGKISRSRQKGVVLVITLIMLVAMTLAVIAMVRSVDTSNLIAGNLAFQQSALLAADSGSEQAINVLIPNLTATKTFNCTINCPLGYISWRQPNQEPPVITWDNFWSNVKTSAITYPLLDALGNATGYTAYYVIQAMCDQNGQGGTCLAPPPSASGSCEGNDLGQADQTCAPPVQKYYRITTRVEGPRNSVAYIQTMIAL